MIPVIFFTYYYTFVSLRYINTILYDVLLTIENVSAILMLLALNKLEC